MKKNKCEQCGTDFERLYIRRFCCKTCWYKWNSKKLAAFNDERFQWNKCTDEEKLERIRSRFEEKVIKSNGCWGWKGHLDKNGYPLLKSGSNGKEFRETRSNRISWLIYKGEIPKGKYILHLCDNSTCTNPDHMFLGTPKENSEDMVRKGRGNKGSKHGNSKLTEDDVMKIRLKFKDGVMIKRIMEDYGISRQTAHNIKHVRIWKHVEV